MTIGDSADVTLKQATDRNARNANSFASGFFYGKACAESMERWERKTADSLGIPGFPFPDAHTVFIRPDGGTGDGPRTE